MYKPGATNRVDALTRREQDFENQAAAKIAIRTQALLRPEQLDPRIQAELASQAQDQDTEIYPIEPADMDLIDELLQANRTAQTLQEHRDKNALKA
jgi:hypothetical protein